MLSVNVEVLPRIHLGLLSMHEGAPRVNGGIGFAISGPNIQIEVIEAQEFAVHDDRPFPMAADELTQLEKSLELFTQAHRLYRHADIRISGEMMTHVGMGSATALRLGAIEGLAMLNAIPLTRESLVAASGRGGTSGIGVNTYFDGGFVCDLGRPNDGRLFEPSSKASPTQLPLALPPVPMPDWPLLLCVPRSITPKTQQEEVAFFERATPLPPDTSFEAAYIALFEIYAAVAERNYRAFCRGIDHMQKTAWKNAERAEYGATLMTLEASLSEAGADCVGMSSLGPMLFCFADPTKFTEISAAARAMACDVYRAAPANRGREVYTSDA